jgi:hypothetical protein
MAHPDSTFSWPYSARQIGGSHVHRGQTGRPSAPIFGGSVLATAVIAIGVAPRPAAAQYVFHYGYPAAGYYSYAYPPYTYYPSYTYPSYGYPYYVYPYYGRGGWGSGRGGWEGGWSGHGSDHGGWHNGGRDQEDDEHE